MRRLVFHHPRAFNALADLVVSATLPGFTKSLRNGLNLGGGDSYKLESGGSEMLLVHNDPDQADVFDKVAAVGTTRPRSAQLGR